MKVKELKAALKDLGLSTKGKKAELEARLAEAELPEEEEEVIEEEIVEEVVEDLDFGAVVVAAALYTAWRRSANRVHAARAA